MPSHRALFAQTEADHRWGRHGEAEGTGGRKAAEQRRATSAVVSKILGEAEDLDEAILRLLRSIGPSLGWILGEIWPVDASAGKLLWGRAWQAPSIDCDVHERESAGLSFLPGEGLLGRVWASASPAWVGNLTTDSAFLRRSMALALGLQGAFAFPLHHRGEVYAVMAFFTHREIKPESDLLANMTDVAQHILQFCERCEAENEQRRLRVALHDRAMEWQTTFDAIEFPVLLLESVGRIRSLNLAACRLLGGPTEAWVGRDLAALGAGEPWVQAVHLLSQLQGDKSAGAAQITDPASGRTWELTANRHLNGGDLRVVLVAREVTATVKLQDSLRTSATMAAMGSLVAGVAHEVRNPLFSISATLDAFEAQFGGGEDYREYLAIFRGELDRVNHLMHDLLEYGRPASYDLTAGDLAPVIADAVEGCRPLAAKARVAIDVILAEDLPPVAMNRRRLIQVFQNLIENSIQHSLAGDRVEVRADTLELDGETLVVCAVEDQGPGFRAEDLKEIFQPFFTRRRGGTGLGLSIVQRIIDEHQGKISAANGAGGGGRVAVSLPAAAPATGPAVGGLPGLLFI